MDAVRVLVLGASGRLGRIIARGWQGSAMDAIWQLRAPSAQTLAGTQMVWDTLVGQMPEVGTVDVVLGLAGVVPGAYANLSLNTDLALAALNAAATTGAKHVFVTSSAAIYGSKPGRYAEAATPQPDTPYGHAKQAMEAAVAGARAALPAGVTCLRIGNVAGADALLGTSARRWRRERGAPIGLDRFADGQGPRRSYIGPGDLADIMAHLCALGANGTPLPAVLNVAAPGQVAMKDLVAAAGVDWSWRPAPRGAVPELVLDVEQLSRLYRFAPDASDATRIVAQWDAML
ncbi:NAD-dependent epimerase/dehydratase family protein [Roseicitreum antarcticum]|uniref:Nucleoside-diphosphate-sugar epimerase n=1 Tax=Roseicitreum antarcticum TaxID=564137 RepID=A0A1H2R7C1_9RHOB|nr:NAD-dependent epimerase/dehydratase family protein [Roseicitreum antarcticum]SDW15261.1 Nucleoside-diphosphate-sugar epimerase [Roseicitreum antarcticum]